MSGSPLQPYRSALEHLQDELQVVFLRVQRYVARHGHRMVQVDGRMSGLYVSFEEARRQLGGSELPAPVAVREGWPDVPACDEAIAAMRARIDERLAASAAEGEGVTLPIEELRQAFRLTDADVDALLAAAATTLSVDLARLYTFAWADFAVKLPTAGFLAELLASDAGGIPAASAIAAPNGVLFERRLLLTRDSTAWGTPTPHLHRGVLAADSIAAWLTGAPGPLPASLAAAARLWTPAEARAVVHGTGDVAERMRTWLHRLGRPSGPSVVILDGAPHSGRRSLLLALAAARGLAVLEVRAPELRGVLPELLADAAREATLRRALLVVRLGALPDEPAWAAEHGPQLRALARAADGLVLLTDRPSASLLRHFESAAVASIPKADASVQRTTWAGAAAELGLALDPGAVETLVSRFDLAPGAIHTALHAAAAGRTRKDGPVAVDAIVRTVHGRIEHALGELAERLTSTLEWSDAVLPKDVADGLAEVVAAARHRATVYDAWGFRRKLSYGRGLSCLFSGPPGTGKTMMAGIIGRTVGADVYRIDLSRIASKWVGETEKNLARLFDEAEKAQVILLFDEADSLFSRRTSVQSANDRFANMEINFLLQRMEAYDGMTILTTNFEESIDAAFKRRIRYVVNFPMPNADERAALWRSMFPPGAPLDPGIDFAWLGERFEIAGGNIKNAVVRAAFHAASSGTAITEAHLVKAATAEAQTLGMAVRT